MSKEVVFQDQGSKQNKPLRENEKRKWKWKK
jgi:hypothetical protein